VHPALPELAVLHPVERDPDRREAERTKRVVDADLVGVAQVDDGADAVRLQRRPAAGGQALERVGAHERAAADGAEAAEVADVAAALPIEVSWHGDSLHADHARPNGFRLS
jgi:hypothetical protein